MKSKKEALSDIKEILDEITSLESATVDDLSNRIEEISSAKVINIKTLKDAQIEIGDDCLETFVFDEEANPYTTKISFRRFIRDSEERIYTMAEESPEVLSKQAKQLRRLAKMLNSSAAIMEKQSKK